MTTRPSKTATNADMMDVVRENEASKWRTEMNKAMADLTEAQSEYHAKGILQKIRYDNQHNELLKYAVLYQVRQEKSYKRGGQTWEEFCESAGEDRRRVEETLKDMKPIYDNFSAEFGGLIKVPFNKIRYLGKAISADSGGFVNGRLVIGEDEFDVVPENAEDISMAITAMQEKDKETRAGLRKQIDRLTKNKDQIVKEATIGLELERDTLLKEMTELKSQIPEEPDAEWFKKEAAEIKDAAARLAVLCRGFINKQREQLRDDRMAQGAVNAFIQAGVGMLEDLMRDFNADFPLFEDDQES